MGNCLPNKSDDNVEETKKTKSLKETTSDPTVVKILLLGTGESGKSNIN